MPFNRKVSQVSQFSCLMILWNISGTSRDTFRIYKDISLVELNASLNYFRGTYLKNTSGRNILFLILCVET